jgi:hypothetical protein
MEKLYTLAALSSNLMTIKKNRKEVFSLQILGFTTSRKKTSRGK